MTSSARIIVFNDDPSEADKLTRKLTAQGYDSVPGALEQDALDVVSQKRPDIVILGGGSGTNSNLNLTRALKSREETANVPVVLIANSDAQSEQTEGLHAGADACLPYPYHDLQLFNRLESLARVGTIQDELHRRAATSAKYGLGGLPAISPPEHITDANFLLVGPPTSDAEQLEQALVELGTVSQAYSTATASIYLERRRFDAILVNLPNGAEDDYLRFCSDIRRNSALFNIPLVCLLDRGSLNDPAQPFAAGVSDVFHRPVDSTDFRARLEMLVRQQRYRDMLLELYSQTHDTATRDALTGMYSHGFLMEHLTALVADAHTRGRSLTLGMFTVDNLAEINAQHGYASGDKILQQIGLLMHTLVRGEDLSARHGGRRFALVMPETRLVPGEHVVHRIGSIVNFTEIATDSTRQSIRPHVTTNVTMLEPGLSAEMFVANAIGKG